MEERILSILEEICEDEVVYEDKDINLKEEGLMDSLAFVELLVRLEEFGLEVAPTEVTYEEIDDYLEGKDIHEKAAETIENWYRKTEHKRHLPITIYDDFWK